jgi:hypothetical protein
MMMATTHALAGIAVASVTLYFSPEQAPVAMAAAAVGGIFPDLDLYAGHRQTLHYPIYYPLVAGLAFGAVAFVSTPLTIAAAWFLIGAALHAVMDTFGGGLELRPWKATSNRAVYDHFNNRWLAPRRWIRYDGAPEDVLLAATFAVPAITVGPSQFDTIAVGLVVLSVAWALVRKPMAEVTEHLVPRLPSAVVARLPQRFKEAPV